MRAASQCNIGNTPLIARNPASHAFAWTGHYAVNRAHTTNGLNQYTTTGGPAFDYDDNGNLISDGIRSYVYDIENRLVSGNPSPGSGGTGATLSYDPLGRLFQVTGGGNTTRFLYDGDALVAEYDGSNAMQRRHIHNVGADVPMVTYEGAGLTTPRHLFADHQGSIIARADAAGIPVTINSYDEYGIPGAGNGGRFQYTGQAWLDELGMYYYKARIYSPTLGRFMQTDPVGYDDQFNLYAYVGNDPVNATDPSGTQTCGGTPINCDAFYTARNAGMAAARNPDLPLSERREISAIYRRAMEDRTHRVIFRSPESIAERTNYQGFAYSDVDAVGRITVLPDNFATLYNSHAAAARNPRVAIVNPEMARQGQNPAAERAGVVGHEFTHGDDQSQGRAIARDGNHRNSASERRADRVQRAVIRGAQGPGVASAGRRVCTGTRICR